jgi:hypothetical protein
LNALLKSLCLAAALGGSGLAHADFVGSLGSITPPATPAIINSAVSVGTLSGVYNFLDTWYFTLTGDAHVGSVTTTFDFGAGPGLTFGITNLQVKLSKDPVVNPSDTLVSWLTVTPAGPGFNSSVALIPASPLLAGNYKLDIRGTLASPGSYGGTLIANAVPLPAALPLFLAGLGALGIKGARKRASAVAA